MSPGARIGRLRFDAESLVLYDGGQVVPLAPLPAKILALLVNSSEQLVATEALRAAVWADATVEERNLNQQLYLLRRALRREPRAKIEYVSRRGYRLTVAVSRSPWRSAAWAA